MTTTERNTPSDGRDARGVDLRPYLVALLATGYVLTWLVLDVPVDAPSAPAARAPIAVGPSTAWIDELPATARPAVSLPAGWRLAERGRRDAPVAARSTPVRVPTARPDRIRTRSS
ncbi:MAG: hypothetical protein U0414_16870 [Polyangiaceae bacterium]